jgi:hypothetical protein
MFLDEELWALCSSNPALPILQAFIGLWCAADREGRFEWRPCALKAQALPYWTGDMETVLGALAADGFVVAYESGGKQYGWIPTFKKHQRPNPKEAQSQLPAPPAEQPGKTSNLDLHASGSGLERDKIQNETLLPFPLSSLSQTQTRATPEGVTETKPNSLRHLQALQDAVRAEFFASNQPSQGAGRAQWESACERLDDSLRLAAFPDGPAAVQAMAKAVVAAVGRPGGPKALGFALQQEPFVAASAKPADLKPRIPPRGTP